MNNSRRAEPRKIRTIETSGQHGDGLDPRYPSARRVRWVSAFLVDWVLHAGPMIAVFAVLAQHPAWEGDVPQARLWALISWPILSFTDRVLLQGFCHATIGKLLFGLVVIRPEDGGWPSFGRLVKVWFSGLFFWIVLIVGFFGNYTGGSGGSGPDFALPAVRRKDVTLPPRYDTPR